jgi:hypothetical protein
MDSGCSRYMTSDKKWFSSLTPLSHKEYVTFGDDKKGKVLDTCIIKVNNNLTLKDVTLVDKLGYNLLSVTQLIDADLDVHFHKSGSKVLSHPKIPFQNVNHFSKGNSKFTKDFSYLNLK